MGTRINLPMFGEGRRAGSLRILHSWIAGYSCHWLVEFEHPRQSRTQRLVKSSHANLIEWKISYVGCARFSVLWDFGQIITLYLSVICPSPKGQKTTQYSIRFSSDDFNCMWPITILQAIVFCFVLDVQILTTRNGYCLRFFGHCRLVYIPCTSRQIHPLISILYGSVGFLRDPSGSHILIPRGSFLHGLLWKTMSKNTVRSSWLLGSKLAVPRPHGNA